MNCHPDTSETDMEVLALVIDSTFMCYAGACTCPVNRYPMHLKGLGNLVDGFPFCQQSQSQSLLFFIELLRPPEFDPEAGR